MEKPDSAGWAQTKLPCPKCSSSDGFNINLEGWGKCFSCGANVPPEGGAEAPAKAAEPVVKNAKLIQPEDIQFMALGRRRISEATCRKFGYGVATYGRDQEMVQVAPYVKKGEVVAQKARTAEKAFFILGKTARLPFFGQHLWPAKGKMVVITEGEIDALSVSEVQDNKWPVVSLPNGIDAAKQSILDNLEWLDGYDRVVLMFDGDKQGQRGAQEAAEALPPGKAYIATMSFKDASEALQAGSGDAIRKAIWDASPWRPDAILDGNTLLARLKAHKSPPGIVWPWDGMKNMAPEHARPARMNRPAIITLVAGTGVGKTTLTRALEHHLITEGERIGGLHLEEDVTLSALGIVGYHLGIRLEHGVAAVDPEALEKAYQETVGREENGEATTFFYDGFGSTALDNIVSRIRFLAKACKCRYVVLDHLSIIVSGLEVQDERKALDVGMTRLRTLVQETGICLILVNHLKRTNGKSAEEGGEVSLADIRGTQAIAQLSDWVIALERDQQAEGVARDCILVRVLKNRPYGPTGPATKLMFVHKTGRFAEVPMDFGEGGNADRSDEDFDATTAPASSTPGEVPPWEDQPTTQKDF
jgi:twinkle protein